MKLFRVRLMIVTALLGVCALSLVPLYVSQAKREWAQADLAGIPNVMGEWQGEDIAVDQQTQDILESSAVLVRKYTSGDRAVWLSLVYYSDNRVALHVPENCSIGAGTDILAKAVVPIAIEGGLDSAANKLVIRKKRSTQIILYYFQAGEFITPSYIKMRWRMIGNYLKNKSSSGALVRYSTIADRGEEEAVKTLQQFISLAAPVLQSHLR
jgi:EpsI family protein